MYEEESDNKSRYDFRAIQHLCASNFRNISRQAMLEYKRSAAKCGGLTRSSDIQ